MHDCHRFCSEPNRNDFRPVQMAFLCFFRENRNANKFPPIIINYYLFILFQNFILCKTTVKTVSRAKNQIFPIMRDSVYLYCRKTANQEHCMINIKLKIVVANTLFFRCRGSCTFSTCRSQLTIMSCGPETEKLAVLTLTSTGK